MRTYRVKHGMWRRYKKNKKVVERLYNCKVEVLVTPREEFKSISYRKRAKSMRAAYIRFNLAAMNTLLERRKGGQQ